MALGGPRGMGMTGEGAGPTLLRKVVAGERGVTCCSCGGRRLFDRIYRINKMGPFGSLSGRAWSRAAREAWRLECRTSATRADATPGAGHSFRLGGLVAWWLNLEGVSTQRRGGCGHRRRREEFIRRWAQMWKAGGGCRAGARRSRERGHKNDRRGRRSHTGQIGRRG